MLITKGKSSKVLSLHFNDIDLRRSKTALIAQLKEFDKYFDWSVNKYVLYIDKKMNTYFATVIVDKDIKKEDMPKDILAKMNVIMVNIKYSDNVIFTIDGLNMLLINKLGVIDKTHNIDWSQYKNSLITKHQSRNDKKPTLVIHKIVKLKSENKKLEEKHHENV